MEKTDRLSPHFTAGELACRCCGKFGPKDGAEIRTTAQFLERVRVYLGNRAIHVNSGYRCPAHNAAVGGEVNSFHMRGFAADITVGGLTPAEVQVRLGKPDSPVAKSGLGSYATFTHVDRRSGKARWRG